MNKIDVRPTKADSSARGMQNEIICWSRMQAESGQQLHEIVWRKELEREANGGIFCWGVGNAPNRCTANLARNGVEVDAVFSVMKSRPKFLDVAPSLTLIWRKFIDYDGRERPLPPGSLVTSKGETRGAVKRSHFALLCKSDSRLVLGDFGSFDPDAYRNLGEIGGAIGNSQVTALLRRTANERANGAYRVNLRATLFGSYWAKLADPIPMDLEKQRCLSIFCADDHHAHVSKWLSLVSLLRENHKLDIGVCEHQLHLF
jgi:hypothetical protein